jgi:hypothetical protein
MRKSVAMIAMTAALVLVPAGIAGAADVQVELVFGTDVDRETRTVVGAAEVFARDIPSVYCLSRIHGLTADTTVTHAWYHEGVTRAKVELPVRSENWRTWSSKKMLPGWTGTWEVKVLDADGTVLATATFELE